MNKLLEFTVLILALCDAESSQISGEASKNSSRQKRLLFYDEEGNLVKTYANPYLRDYAGKIPSLGNIFNPFLSFLRPTTFAGPTAYMIPVSDEVIQHINSDPVYQNKLLNIPRKDLVIEPNPLCAGKRAQIPTEKCGNFLNCWDGWAFEQECPEGLMFSREGYCDYPQNVDCSKRSKEPSTMITSTVPASTQCNTEFESFRNEMQCSEFFVCVDRVPIKFKCPADLAYSQTLGVCDYRYKVDCNTPIAIAVNDQADQPKAPCSSTADAKDPLNSSIQAPGQTSSAPVSQESPPGPELKTVLTTNSVVDSQSWTSTHVAISRQDAIRQLKLESIANVAV